MPKWHNLFLPKSNKQQGQILLSFYIFESSKYQESDLKLESLSKRIDYIPEVCLYNCEINILGLRQLKPLGMIEVKKPFIKFDLNSLNVTGKPEDAQANIQTVPVSGGANPTINTILKFDAKLPKNYIFMPELQCEVYDHILSGLHNSLLGVFSLNLKRIIKKTDNQLDEDMISARKTLGTSLFSEQIRKSLDLSLMKLTKGNDQGIIKEEDGNEISTATNKANNLFDITKTSDPLSSLVEKDKEEESNKLSSNIQNSLYKSNNKDEDEDSEKNSDENFLEVDEDKVEDKGENINIDEMNLNKVCHLILKVINFKSDC